MKKIISIAIAALVVIAGVSSCKNDKKKESKTQTVITEQNAYLTAIPQNAAAVLKLNAGMLLQQSEILDNADFRDLLDSASQASDMVVDAIQNPEKLGLNLDRPVFLAYDGGARATFVASVDGDKLSTVFALFALGGAVIENEGEISYVRLDRDALVAYNSSAAVLVAGDDINKDYVTNLLKQNSVTSAAGFDKFIADESPIALWGEYEGIMKNLKSLRRYMSKSDRAQFDNVMAMVDQYDLSDAYMLMTTTFDRNGMYIDAYVSGNDDLMALSTAHAAKMDPEMLEYLPKDMCFAFTANFNDLKGLLQTTFANVEDGSKVMDMLNETLASANLDISDLPESFAFAVAPLSSLEKMPDFALVCKASPKLYNTIEPFLPELRNDFGVVVSYNNGYLSLTTKALSLSTNNGRFEYNMTNMTKSPYANLMTSSLGGAMVIDMSNVFLRKILAETDMNGEVIAAVQTLLKLVRNLTVFSELDGNVAHSRISLGVNTHGDNALKTFVDTVLDIVMENFNTPEITYEEFSYVLD